MMPIPDETQTLPRGCATASRRRAYGTVRSGDKMVTPTPERAFTDPDRTTILFVSFSRDVSDIIEMTEVFRTGKNTGPRIVIPRVGGSSPLGHPNLKCPIYPLISDTSGFFLLSEHPSIYSPFFSFW